MVRHLYVHIPFCPKVCPYCSFYKETSDRNKTQGFLDAVLAEAEIESPGLQPHTVFFGGGTPTALSTSQLEYLIQGLKQRVDWSQVREFTIEMNPATVSCEKATALLQTGVNRVSMGVQSWDEALLKTLGRVHNAAQASRSYRILREAGVPNVNLDLIFGIPGQSAQQWRDSLRQTIDLGPDHISAYCLTYEEDTEFFRKFQIGEMAPEESRDSDFFEMAMDELSAAGYEQYEISNYAIPGRVCEHNLAYWRGNEYAGLGPSAFSTRHACRRRTVADTADYIRRMTEGVDRFDFTETLDEATRRAEWIAFALRTSEGLPENSLPPERISPLLQENLITQKEGRLRLTRSGKLVADEIAAELI